MGAKEREKIRKGIRELGKAGKCEIYRGEVDSIDEDQQTIDVKINDDVIIPDVLLKGILNDDSGDYRIPSKGSIVVIGQMDGGVDFCLIQASKIDKIKVKIEDMTYEADKDGFVYNGGNNDGIAKIKEQVKKYNAIEKDVNNLKSILQTVLNAPVNEPGNGAQSSLQTALKGALASWYGQQLTETQQADLENKDVKH